MPHGLTVDHEDNLWLTDVALHQVFKFPPLVTLSGNVTKPLLILGERFINGKDDSHFCKPSAVAVMKDGDFFVSDGYCNSRIIKFSSDGMRLMSWGRNTFSGKLLSVMCVKCVLMNVFVYLMVYLYFFLLILGTYGHRPAPYQFQVPHALTLAEDRGLVCVADRENGRVQCFFSHNGTFVHEIASETFGTRVFSVAYSPTKGKI